MSKSKARKLAEFLRNITVDSKLTTEGVEDGKIITTGGDLDTRSEDTTSLVSAASVTSYVGTKLGDYVHGTHDINLTFTGDVTGHGTITDMSHTTFNLTLDAETLPVQAGYAGKFLTTNGTVASWATVDTSNGDTAFSWGDHATAGYATEGYVTSAVSDLVDNSPGTLDTLNELAAALNDDPNFAATTAASIGTKWTQDNTKISNWDTAYGWGNHASAGYLSLTGGTMSGSLTIGSGTISLKSGNAQYWVSSGGGYQRADSRSESTTLSRLHWYGVRNDGGTSNFRHAWYDGGSYIDVTANAGGRIDFTGNASSMYIGSDRVFDDGYHPNADKWTTARTLSLTGDVTGSVSLDGSANASITTVVGNDSHTHDGRYYTEAESNGRFTRFINNATLNSSTSTTSFIAELINDHGCFQNNSVTLKCSWSYAGNSNLDTGHPTIGTIELAGCVVETWGGTYKHVRITRPTTGTGGAGVYEYNDQGSGYSPGWREIWTSQTDGSGSGLDADLLDGQQGSYYYPASNPNGYTTNTGNTNEGGTSFNGEYPVVVRVSANNIYSHTGIKFRGSDKKLTVGGTITAASYVYNSDAAFKENIEPLENSLDTILKLEGVKYTLKESGKSSIGFIAQDVEKVIPEFVEGDEGHKGVNYGQMVAVLVEAMKEQQKQIEELKNEIKQRD